MPNPWLQKALQLPNLAQDLSDEDLGEIGQRVVSDYDIDKNSRADWEKISENAMKLAKQVREEKNEPWAGAANVKLPLLTTACIQFGARAYPELIRGNDVVKCTVVGDDSQGLKEQRADRISKHMSWQLLKQMDGWEEDVDAKLHTIPIDGGVVKKSYFDPIRGKNVSELINLEDFVVNAGCRNLATARRKTHRLWYYQNDVWEKVKRKLWQEIELGTANPSDEKETSQADYDLPHEFLEQHRYWDLDDDGYEEPYIITVHKQTSKVVRIFPRFNEDSFIYEGKQLVRIEPEEYFTLFPFLPNFGGGFYPIGFGQLAEPLNEAANTLCNQLLDSGTMANRAGGFLGRGIKIKGGKMEFNPFEWKQLRVSGGTLKDNIFPLPVREPSAVLFQLLSLLMELTKDVTSVKDVLTGDAGLGANVPVGTVLSLIEQGLKVYTGIYKRLWRAFGEEFKKLFKLNARYMKPEDYFRVLDTNQREPITLNDYQQSLDDLDVYPTADPSAATNIQRIAKAQANLQLSGRPGVKEEELTREMFEAINPGNSARFILTEEEKAKIPPPPPDPRLVEAQAKIKDMEIRREMDLAKLRLEMEKLEAEIGKIKADSIKSLADAESKEPGQQIEQYKLELETLKAKHQADIQERQLAFQEQSMQQEQETAPSTAGSTESEAGI